MTRARLESLIGGNEADAGWASMPEAERVDAVKSFGAVPVGCGSDIPAAVARGPVSVKNYTQVYQRGDGQLEEMPAGHKGRSTPIVADVFDRMAVQSKRKGADLALSVNQIEMGRIYARMVERHQAGAVKCSSFDAGSGTGGGADGFTDARLASARRIDLWHKRLVKASGLDVQRVVAGSKRYGVSARTFVDAVCLEDLEVSRVLRRFGWSVNGKTVGRAFEVLGKALDCMAEPMPRHGIRTVRMFEPQKFF